MAGSYRVEGIAVPETLSLLHDLLARVGVDHPDVCAEDLYLFETAVIEIAGNMVKHGRPAGAVLYAFTLQMDPDSIRGTLADAGQEGTIADQPMTMPDDALAQTGRGLALARAVLDELRYARVGGANTWTLVRLRR